MAWNIGKGQEVFRNIVEKFASGAVVNFGEASQGRYPVTIITPKKSFKLYILEEDFADLAHNGGRKADITMRIRQALADS